MRSQAPCRVSRLQLAQCELEELPPLIGGFYLLRLLDLSDNKLEELPPDIGSCYSLTTLNVSTNQIKVLPDEIAQLIHLENFMFYSNKIVNLPEWVGSLQLLTMNGFNNRILKLPLALGKLREITEINLAANVMMQLPSECLEDWRNVRILNLYDSRLMKLCSLAGLESLEELRLFNNNLEDVPELGGRLHNLKSASRVLHPCAPNSSVAHRTRSLSPMQSLSSTRTAFLHCL